MVWKGYRSRLHECNDFNAYGLFSRDNELLSQAKIFKNETTTSGKETTDRAEDGPSDLEHAPDITCGRKEATGLKFLKSKPSKVLASERDGSESLSLREHSRGVSLGHEPHRDQGHLL